MTVTDPSLQSQMTNEWSRSIARERRQPQGRRARSRRRQETGPDWAERSAQALGWFSLGLGLAEAVSPRTVGGLAGIEGGNALLRAFGLREMAAGAGILSQRRPAVWMWSRVAGDALDLAVLGNALARSKGNERGRTIAATAAVAGITALDAFLAWRLSQGKVAAGVMSGPVEVVKAITVNRPPEEVYRFWRDFANLPRILPHLEEVRVLDERRSHWRTSGPAGMSVEWDAEITEERPNERLAWRAVGGADIANSGVVSFKPGPAGRGTEISVEMRYELPGGKIGAALGKLFGNEPSQQLQEGLRAFKALIETGETPRSEASLGRFMHAAQPS